MSIFFALSAGYFILATEAYKGQWLVQRGTHSRWQRCIITSSGGLILGDQGYKKLPLKFWNLYQRVVSGVGGGLPKLLPKIEH